MEFDTDTFQRMADLTAYYNMRQWYYLRVGFDETDGLFPGVLGSDRGKVHEVGERVDVRGWDRFHLRAEFDHARLWFLLSLDGETTTIWGFTGAFVGLWAHDLTGTGSHADFDHATYREPRD